MNNMNFRNIIEQEFSYRTSHNPSYSLRSFARDLKINPSQLCEIRKGKIGLSSKKALEVAKGLGLSEKESKYFKALVEIEHGRSQDIKDKARAQIEEHQSSDSYKGLTNDGFTLISQWHHYAILSAMELDAYDGSVEWVANHLNISIDRCGKAIKRLIKLDLIDFENGKFIASQNPFTTTNEIASQALKIFHKQHLNKAIKAIDNVDVKLRDITSMTMAIDIERLPEAKQMLKEFRRKFCHEMENGKKNTVYNLNLQFVPLREIEMEQE